MKDDPLPNLSCPHAILARHGKSFAWAARLMPARYARRAAQLYAVCRAVDDLVDSPLNSRCSEEAAEVVPERTRRAERLERLRDDLFSARPYDALAKEFRTLSEETGLDLTAAAVLIDGVRSDIGRVRIADEAALLRYAYRVAGTVGVMMCDVLDVKHTRARPHAIDLGMAMQLTNIARDVSEDAGLDRRYLPASWIDVEPRRLLASDAEVRVAASKAVLRLLDLADRFYISGFAGLSYLPLQVRPAIAAAGGLYRGIGTELRRRDGAFWAGRVTLSPARKAFLTGQAMTLLSSPPRAHDTGLHRYLGGLPHVGLPPAEGELHATA